MGGPAVAPDPAAKAVGKGILSRALNEWLAGLAPPTDPPFTLNAAFPDEEWNHFFRVFSISTVLAAAVVSANEYAATKTATLASLGGPSTQALKALAVFAFFSFFYSVYARVFGIRLTMRQTLFCFSLVLVPWFPLAIVLKALGGALGIAWFLAFYGMFFYVLYLLASALSKVSGAAGWKAGLSFVPPIVLAIVVFVANPGGGI